MLVCKNSTKILQDQTLMLKHLIQYLAQTDYVRSAIKEGADLTCFRQKPTPRIIWGLVVIAISYAIGWPVVGILGLIAVYLNQPLIVAVGGPAFYALSHLTFMAGAWLAGANHAKAFMRWATRQVMLKLAKYA